MTAERSPRGPAAHRLLPSSQRALAVSSVPVLPKHLRSAVQPKGFEYKGPPDPTTPWGATPKCTNAAASKRTHVGARQFQKGMVWGKNRLTSSLATLPYAAKVQHNRPGFICTHAAPSPAPKCFICSWDFLGGAAEAAGRQESSYNTGMGKTVPGRRRWWVALWITGVRAFGSRARPPGGLGPELPEDFGCLGKYLGIFFQMEAHTGVVIAG